MFDQGSYFGANWRFEADDSNFIDFNPFQDLQAVARAHRFGQVNPVQVFKLLVKDTCEEKIFKDGGRKMGLDHLIIQRLDADTELEADVSSLAGLVS